jgi:hypothetical protein
MATTAYFVEERGEIDRRAKKEKETRIFDMQKYGELKSFKTKNTHLIFKEQRAHIKKTNHNVDKIKLNLAFEVLAKIRLQRILENKEVTAKNRKFFFPSEQDYMEFQFSLRKVKYLIGKKLATDRSFYMEIVKDNKVYHVIAHNPSDVKVAMKASQAAQDDTHYRELKSVLKLEDDFFVDKHIFNKHVLANTEEIYFQNKRNRSFRLNLLEGTTLPKTPQNIILSKKKSFDYLENLAKLEAVKIYDTFHPSEYYGELAHITFKVKNSKEWSMKLYSEFKEVKGFYLLKGERLYTLDKKNINLFMANTQDFWIKKIRLPSNGEAKLKFANSNTLDIKINDQQKFEVITKNKNKTINHAEFQKIYNFLKTEADFISESDKYGYNGESESILDLDLENLALNITKTKGEIIVHDKSHNLEYHYIVGNNVPFSMNADEVIIKQ